MRERRLCEINIPRSDFSQYVKEQWLLLVAAGALKNKQKFMSPSRSPPPSPTFHPVLLSGISVAGRRRCNCNFIGIPTHADPESFNYCTKFYGFNLISMKST